MRPVPLTVLVVLVALLAAGLGGDRAAAQVPDVTETVKQAAPTPVAQVVDGATEAVPPPVTDAVEDVTSAAPAPPPAPAAPAPVNDAVQDVTSAAPAPVQDTVSGVVEQAPAPVRDTVNQVAPAVTGGGGSSGGGSSGGGGSSTGAGAPGSGGDNVRGGAAPRGGSERASGRRRAPGRRPARAEAVRVRERRLRAIVRRLSGCLDVLTAGQERVLRLRAALDRPGTRSRLSVAERAGMRPAAVARIERRGLKRLRTAARADRCGSGGYGFDAGSVFGAGFGAADGDGDGGLLASALGGGDSPAVAAGLLGDGPAALLAGVRVEDGDGAVAGERTSSVEAGGERGGLPSPLSLLPIDDASDLPFLLLLASLAAVALFFAARRDVRRQ